jgi:hypothetical protein
VGDTGRATSQRSFYSKADLTVEHLRRLAGIADADHLNFTRPSGRPDYADRRVAVVLAQGAAQHYVQCITGMPRRARRGVKDLDVWTFYAAIPGTRFPADKRTRVVDFGPSELGRRRFDLATAQSPYRAAQWKRWEQQFEGRSVDLMVRPLHLSPDATSTEVIAALRNWLDDGGAQPPSKRRSNGWLARRPVILLWPSRTPSVIWQGLGRQDG